MDKMPKKGNGRSAQETQLLDLLLKRKGIQLPQAQTITRRTNPDPAPLSFAQQRLWFIQQLDPESWAYNISEVVTLSGPLDVSALEQSLIEICHRHEALRTTFQTIAEQPVQVVSETPEVSLQVIDLRQLPEAERALEVRRLETVAARQPFDMAQAPLLRATLLHLANEEHKLLLTVHHIISDGWSMRVVIRELVTLYEAYRKRRPSPLPPLPLQYPDYALWQRRSLDAAALSDSLRYWQLHLRLAPALLELPSDYPRPPRPSLAGRSFCWLLPASVSARLSALSRRHGVTLFMTLLSAFQILLSRYSGQPHVVVGTPIANRQRPELEPLIGCFVNTLALHTDFCGDPRVAELLATVREVCLGAYAHQDLPFEKLVEALEPERNLSHTPLFQVLFVLQNTPPAEMEVEGLRWQSVRNESETAKFDLTLEVEEEAGGELRCRMEYRTELFAAETVRRMAQHYSNVVEGIVEDERQRVSQIKLLSMGEREQIVEGWNRTQEVWEGAGSVVEMVEEAAQRWWEKEAVRCGEEGLSYREMNERANRVGHYLREKGVREEELVGVMMERSEEMVVVVLGIMKAGGAYVALEGSYPEERVRYMIEDAGVRMMMTSGEGGAGVKRWCEREGIEVIKMEEARAEIARQSGDNPVSCIAPDSPVYVTYTSGSTGRPKGIVMPHRALLNLLSWQYHHSRMPEGAKTLQFASLSFDVSFQDIFSTWCSGGTLVLISEAMRQDIKGLARLIVEEGVNRIFIPAVALQQLAEGFCDLERVDASLKKVIAGSEQLHVSQALTKMFTQLEGCYLHNEYGPSEAHVVTAFALPASPARWPQRPPIGRPISNVRIYLLDSYGQVTPIGVPGELHIGGVSLARGYLGRPDLTAEKFVPDQFSSEPGGRLYKTGDHARYLPDGNIEFLGRIDHQVKIRGFRVELAEIEVVLGEHPAVQKTIVLAYDQTPGDTRLVAYLVAEPGQAPSISELRNFLSEKLPQYMMPSHFVTLDSLPLTPNGKVDRKALPLPDQMRPHLDQDFVAPRNGLEEALAGIWAEILKIEKVGIHDNFFELGGHSLLATQLISRCNAMFRLHLPLRTIFETPTVAGIAERMVREEPSPGILEKMAVLLKQLDTLSEEEAEERLSAERSSAEG